MSTDIGNINLVDVDASGKLEVTLATAIMEGVDGINSYPPRSSFVNISANTAGTVVKASAGFLLGIIINTAGVTNVLTIYNHASATTNKFGAYSANAQVYLPVQAYMSNGIYIVLAGGTAADLTLVYV